MEPVKGGNLVNLPAEADRVLRDLNGGSNASYAIRFAASFPNMAMVLSGMSDMAQMEDNLSAMKDFRPLDETELAAVRRVCDIFRSQNLIPCTACRYCVEENECPKAIRIPDLFSSLNAHEAFHDWNSKFYYGSVVTGGGHGKASECLKCGLCEKNCPQHISIRKLLEEFAALYET
jgi:predicted aldo/keto reductase-like oxidoreductase